MPPTDRDSHRILTCALAPDDHASSQTYVAFHRFGARELSELSGAPFGWSGSGCRTPSAQGHTLAPTGVIQIWRRGWDSNPRLSFPNTRFPSVLLKPLGHLSVLIVDQVSALTVRVGGAFVT